MRTTGIIFAIVLLATSLANAQENTREWYQEKEQSWARAKVDYPESAISGPFLNRMVEIDKWAKQNNPSLYKNSNKPYLMAQMVQREVDQARARQTVPTVPPQMPSPTAMPTVSSPAPQPSYSPALQQIAQSHKSNVDLSAIWLGAAIIVALTSAVAYLFLRVVRPKNGVKTAVALGRRWAAWAGFFATLGVMPQFFREFDANSLAIWILAIGFFTPGAFVIGWIIGKFRYRKSTIGLHQVNPPEIIEVKDLKSPPKTVLLTKAKGPPTTVLLTTAKGPSMNKDILTDKLRDFAERGNIEMERCIEIAQAANDAIIVQSKGGDLTQMATAMLRCCGADEDEAAYFRCAVDSLLQEKWRAKPKDSAVLTGMMNMTYQGLVDAGQVRRGDI